MIFEIATFDIAEFFRLRGESTYGALQHSLGGGIGLLVTGCKRTCISNRSEIRTRKICCSLDAMSVGSAQKQMTWSKSIPAELFVIGGISSAVFSSTFLGGHCIDGCCWALGVSRSVVEMLPVGEEYGFNAAKRWLEISTDGQFRKWAGSNRLGLTGVKVCCVCGSGSLGTEEG